MLACFQTRPNFKLNSVVNGRVVHIRVPYVLRGPTHQKWSNFVIFGFIVQFDPWVAAHLWEKIRVLGALETPQMGGERSPSPLGKIWKFANFVETWLLYVKYKNKTIFFYKFFSVFLIVFYLYAYFITNWRK